MWSIDFTRGRMSGFMAMTSARYFTSRPALSLLTSTPLSASRIILFLLANVERGTTTLCQPPFLKYASRIFSVSSSTFTSSSVGIMGMGLAYSFLYSVPTCTARYTPLIDVFQLPHRKANSCCGNFVRLSDLIPLAACCCRYAFQQLSNSLLQHSSPARNLAMESTC